NELMIATVEAAAAAASDDEEPASKSAIFASVALNCCKPEATVQSIESSKKPRPDEAASRNASRTGSTRASFAPVSNGTPDLVSPAPRQATCRHQSERRSTQPPAIPTAIIPIEIRRARLCCWRWTMEFFSGDGTARTLPLERRKFWLSHVKLTSTRVISSQVRDVELRSEERRAGQACRS